MPRTLLRLTNALFGARQSPDPRAQTGSSARTLRNATSTGAIPARRRPIILPPLPPAIAPTMLVESGSDASVTYSVNLAALTCTCANFTKERSGYVPLDIRRVCKHARIALEKSGAMDCYSAELRAVLTSENRVTFHDSTPSGGRVVFQYVPGEPWIDVHTRKRKKGEKAGVFTGDFAVYGFNLDEERWSYGSGPPGAGEIREMIRRHFLE
jgi:hypothetical protein